MIEIRIHGRGGQGVKKAAQLLARAAFLSGYKTQDFAMYGAERRGAPVTSFVRIDKSEILTRGYVFEPDYVIILDGTLDMDVCLKGRKRNTEVLVNSQERVDGFCYVDAMQIAIDVLGRPIPNSALLGAFTKVMGKIPLKNLKKAFAIEFEKLTPEVIRMNERAAELGAKRVKLRQKNYDKT